MDNFALIGVMKKGAPHVKLFISSLARKTMSAELIHQFDFVRAD